MAADGLEMVRGDILLPNFEEVGANRSRRVARHDIEPDGAGRGAQDNPALEVGYFGVAEPGIEATYAGEEAFVPLFTR